MKRIKFDFNNMFSHCVGRKDGVTGPELRTMSRKFKKAHSHLIDLIEDRDARIGLGLEWAMLPFQDANNAKAIQDIGGEIAAKYENVISLGIGGSYLGLKAAQDALCPPYYNEFKSLRGKRPRMYFDGNNLDPDTLSVLLKNLDPKKTFVIVISKSGETTETKAAFMLAERWLKRGCGRYYGRQVFVITDPVSGTLRVKTEAENNRDRLSFRSLPVLKGVGGRFSELNIGLLHLAIIGVEIRDVLSGAAEMAKRCTFPELLKNPAGLYAALHTILYRKKGKDIAVLMPFSETLKCSADWYVQLLAESLGKKYGRKIFRNPSGNEAWLTDTAKILNAGRTPLSARGTNDLHSIQQNNIEGENNKVLTFIKVERFKNDLNIDRDAGILSGRPYSELLALAEEATEWALARQSRPSCTISLPEITPRHWGGLIFFLEMATAYEGEFLEINAFDQPGVEGYKNYMYYKLGKSGIPTEIADEIRNHPLKKLPRFII